VALPQEIKDIISQTGGNGLYGAFAYIGARAFTYEYTTFGSKFENGYLKMGVGLMFKVNGGNRGWRMAITVEPDDTYTVRLIAVRGKAKLLDEKTNVYCDNLKNIVEDMYDNAIKNHCNGFITIG
jgi:hypothetical protein